MAPQEVSPAPRSAWALSAHVGGWATFALLLAACSTNAVLSASNDDGSPSDFGRGASDIPQDAGTSDAGTTLGGDAATEGQATQLRLMHGLVNLGRLRLCFDPDLVVDDPRTPADESTPGTEPPREVPLPEPFASGIQFREATGFFGASLPDSGALLLVDSPELLVDAGPAKDPYYDDGGLPHDASTALDGSADDDAAATEPIDGGATVDAGYDASSSNPCEGTPRAVLPLPLPPWWLPSADGDDAADAFGLTSSLAGSQRITLYGSGLLLTDAMLATRREAARAEYLAIEPEDLEGADIAGQTAVSDALAALGPRLLPAPATTAVARGVTLSVVHLIPDVAGDDGPGAIRLCMTVNKLEGSAVPPRGEPGVAFRARSTLFTELDASSSYRVRIFSASSFDQEAKGCATTSLEPVAEQTLAAGELVDRRAYTLVLSGAQGPDSLCAAEDAGAPPSPTGCAESYELEARIDLLED